MFGWKRRRARRARERAAGGAHLLKDPVDTEATTTRTAPADDPAPQRGEAPERSERIRFDDDVADESGPGSESEPEPDDVRAERPIVDLLAEGERLGFEPELHIPDD